ncbi:hypothetical protein HFP72_02315 [Nocardiopsis sp. ARC36]
MAAAGFGGAYYFGWFGPEDVHASPPGPCDLLDTDAASEIAGNGENLEVYEADHSYAYGAEGLECVVTPASRPRPDTRWPCAPPSSPPR